MARLHIIVTILTTVLALFHFGSVACAAEQSASRSLSGVATATSPLLNFQFDYYHSPEPSAYGKELLHTDFSSEVMPEPVNRVRQYDAAFYYPLPRPGMNFGVGINIRLINRVFSETENGETSFHNFSEAIPMFYATALFDLPFKGLSAGFEGLHTELPINARFDYKAKLHYQWNDVLGFEGGWQHQQQPFTAGPADLQETEGSDSLYLDFRLNF